MATYVKFSYGKSKTEGKSCKNLEVKTKQNTLTIEKQVLRITDDLKNTHTFFSSSHDNVWWPSVIHGNLSPGESPPGYEPDCQLLATKIKKIILDESSFLIFKDNNSNSKTKPKLQCSCDNYIRGFLNSRTYHSPANKK